MKAWIDRNILINDAKNFIKQYGYFFRKYAKRISGLVEIAVYNSIVDYYSSQKYKLEVKKFGPKKSFRYRVSGTGLLDNYSYFQATKKDTKEILLILQNLVFIIGNLVMVLNQEVQYLVLL